MRPASGAGRSSGLRRLALGAAAGVFAGLTVAGVASPQTPQPPQASRAEATAAASYREVSRSAMAEGVVEAVRQSAIAAQVAGRVVALKVKAGDAVKAGELLVQIDPRSASQAQAASQSQVHEAEANLANAKAAYDRSRKLVVQKFISEAALDQARAQYLAAQAQAATAIANARVSATSTSYTTVVAPYDGVVASTDVEVGDMATPGRPLVTVFDPDAMRVTATLAQAVLARADLGAPIEVEIPSRDLRLTAVRVTMIPIADVRTHTTQVRLDLPRSAGLMPGQYARAAIVTGHARVLTIPEAAVLRRSEVTAVYVPGAGGRAQLRQVRLGEPAGDGLVEVLAGLHAGERVYLDPVRAGIEDSVSPRS